jgi:hypothetical protein
VAILGLVYLKASLCNAMGLSGVRLMMATAGKEARPKKPHASYWMQLRYVNNCLKMCIRALSESTDHGLITNSWDILDLVKALRSSAEGMS